MITHSVVDVVLLWYVWCDLCCGWVVRVVVVVLCCAELGVVVVCVRVRDGALSLKKPKLCVHSKRSRVYVQNASMCRQNAPVCHVTHGRSDGTH